jgi:septal ring-binding cell division protein DamX
MSNQQKTPAPEEGSKMDALVKVVLVFFISLLSFSVGTFVGKQVSDSDHRRASLEGGENASTEVAAATPEEKTEAASEEEVSNKEVEDLASEFVQDDNTRTVASEKETDGYSDYHGKKEPVAAAAPAATPPAVIPAQKNAPAKPAVMEAAEKVSKGEAPTSGKMLPPPRKPSSTLPAVASSTVGKYTVQVASFATENDAKQRASALKAKGWNAFYVPAEIKGKTWYRVSIGMFEESQNAQAFMQKYLKESGSKDALVTKIVQ